MKYPFYLLALFLATVIVACKKKQPTMKPFNEDCSCANEVSADFNIEERFNVIGGEWVYIITDTTHHTNFIKYTALAENANYRWYIGGQQYSSKEVELYVSSNLAGQNVTITCVVEAEPHSKCFPNDDGYDSVVKTFKISNYPIYNSTNDTVQFGIEGTYRVRNAIGSDSIDISLNFANYYGLYDYIQIINFDGLGGQSIDSSKQIIARSYRRVDFTAGDINNYSKSLSGSIFRKTNDKAYLSFTSVYKPSPNAPIVTTVWEYEGRKLN